MEREIICVIIEYWLKLYVVKTCLVGASTSAFGCYGKTIFWQVSTKILRLYLRYFFPILSQISEKPKGET